MKWVLGVSVIAIVMGWAATATIPAATPSIDDVSLKFLPPDTQGIVFIDLAALRNAPLTKDALKSKNVVPHGIDRFMAATGFDPERDIDKVTIGKISAGDGLVIVQGRIDKFKVEQFLKDKGKTGEAYLGQTLYHDGDTSFVLLENVALFGQPAAVKKAVDQMQLPGSLPLRNDLTAAIQTIEAGSQVWGAGDFSINDLGTVGIRGPAPVVDMLKSLRSGTYQMRIDTGVHARAVGNFADIPSAKNVGELVRGTLAIARVQVARKQQDVLLLLDGIQVSDRGATIVVTIEETGETLQKLQSFYRPTIERAFQ